MNDGMVALEFQGGGTERKEKKILVLLVYVWSYNLKRMKPVFLQG